MATPDTEYITVYSSPSEFLNVVQPLLQLDEAANNVMLGIAIRLVEHPEFYKVGEYSGPPFCATVSTKQGIVAVALMTPPHDLLVFKPDPSRPCESAWELVASHLRKGNWPIHGVLGKCEIAEECSKVVAKVFGKKITVSTHERIYRLEKVIQNPKPSGCARVATMEDINTITQWFHAFVVEALLPTERLTLTQARTTSELRVKNGDYYLWEDAGKLVTMVGMGRKTPHGRGIGTVYTPPEFRNKGYATATTAYVSEILLNAGNQFTFLLTNLANPTANSIYQKIGYFPVCDMTQYHIEK